MAKYTISSCTFTSLKAVAKQLQKWENKGTLDPKTKTFEIKKEVKIINFKNKNNKLKYKGRKKCCLCETKIETWEKLDMDLCFECIKKLDKKNLPDKL